ncbi:DUF6573 family protein [Streptomyces rubradiris]|uniref:Uncharacterized protein n=1 Tax=Streptomyces rubradiris TaxID=285531 RepID=A0ABQ3RAG9_STRRR|nr:DUF6573 family protein [Streptomyces rubradiris]GHH31475.1 hypothetical protein GCM10018792_79250 [Streptomyces rubradiris]GHI52844.1 hypothetical protein Srubr_26900 [Streptomyces rubradiris]
MSTTPYTRAHAIKDGRLIEADPGIVEELQYPAPVAMTEAVYRDCVAVPDGYAWETGIRLDPTEREWDLLLSASIAIKAAAGTGRPPRLAFTLYRVPVDGGTRQAQRVTLVAEASPGDQGERVITIMRPTERLPY